MPIFEYECAACSRRFDHLVSNREESEPACPQCGGVRVRRLLSVFAVGGSQPAPAAGCGKGDCACRAEWN